MSENKAKLAQLNGGKGFRQEKKPTKGDVQKENQQLANQLQGQLQFLNQQMMNSMMESRKLAMEVNAMANLLRCEKVTGPAKKGDHVMIDYVGRIKDEAGELKLFEGGFGLGYTLELGTNSLIPGFEDQLEDLSAGDEKTVEVTFPDSYPENLKEKAATFEVKVIGVWKKQDSEDRIKNLQTKYAKAEEEALQKEKGSSEKE